jgi:hypothetical protein
MSSRTASPTRRWSKAICPRSSSSSAACSASTGPASTAPSSSSAASSAPASRFARAAASRRRAASALGGELGRAVEERGCGGDASARQRATGRALELLGDLLVGRGRRLREVPGAPVRVELRIGGLGERGVRPAAVRHGRAAVDGGADQRMTEAGAVVDRDQVVGAGERVVDVHADGRRGLVEEGWVPDRLGGRDHQEPLRRLGHPLHATGEALLDARGQGTRARQPEAARQLGRVAATRELEQRERVAGRLGDDAIADPVVQRPGDHRPQQGSRVVVAEALDHQLRQPAQLAVIARFTRREDERDRLGEHPAGDERDDLGRRAVEPLRVVDQTDQRPLLGGIAQQAQHREADREPIRRFPRPHAERRGQRVALRRRQVLQPIQQRRAELMQPRERELHLGLDADRVHDPAARRPLRHVPQQRRLAHPRVAAHHQRPALARAHSRRPTRPAPRARCAAPGDAPRHAESPWHADPTDAAPGWQRHARAHPGSGTGSATDATRGRSEQPSGRQTRRPALNGDRHELVPHPSAHPRGLSAPHRPPATRQLRRHRGRAGPLRRPWRDEGS